MDPNHAKSVTRPRGWYLALMGRNTKGPEYAWLDPSSLYGDADAFQEAVDDLAKTFDQDAIDVVAGIDAMGFILGAAVARRLRRGFLPLRKHPHLCVDVITEPYVDYTGRSKILEVRTNPFPKGSRLLLVDQWIETGGTMLAAMRLVEKVDGVVVGVAAIAVENSAGANEIKTKVKVASCIPTEEVGEEEEERKGRNNADDWQQQIDRRFLKSWEK